MGAGGERLCEGVLALVGAHQLRQRSAIDCALVGQFLRQRDRLAVVIEVHQYGHVLLRTASAQVHAVHQPIQYMGRVEFTVHQLVAHGGPGSLLAQDDLDAVFLVEAQHRSHHDRGAIGQWNEADFDFFFLRLVGACSPGVIR